MISHVTTKIKNAPTREQRFTLLENVQILTVILQDVVQFENNLMMDLDVD